MFILQFKKIPICIPWKVIGNFKGWGISNANIFKGKYELDKLEISDVWVGGSNQKTFPKGVGYGYFLEEHIHKY